MSVYKHILVPTDFSDYSRHAVAKALELRALFDARLSVLHVVDYLPPDFIAGQSGAASSPQIIDRARQYLSEWSDQAGLANAEQIIATGPAGREIANTAREKNVDLVVIGTSGEGGIKRLLGSTTRSVMHDPPCDVLSVHM